MEVPFAADHTAVKKMRFPCCWSKCWFIKFDIETEVSITKYFQGVC